MSNVLEPGFDLSIETIGMISLFDGIVTIIAALLAIMVVRDITSRQEKRHEAVKIIETAEAQPLAAEMQY